MSTYDDATAAAVRLMDHFKTHPNKSLVDAFLECFGGSIPEDQQTIDFSFEGGYWRIGYDPEQRSYAGRKYWTTYQP